MANLISMWLLRKAEKDFAKAKKVYRENKRLHAEYARRNRGEDGWRPGIWYQEQEISEALPTLKAEMEFLRSVVRDLKNCEL
jgi:hypothetical protein